MKPANYRIPLSFCLLLLCAHISLAQEEQKIHADWLATDVANVERFLPQLMRNEPLTPAALETIFGAKGREEDLGFGGRTFQFGKPGGYCHLRVDGFVFNDTVGYYTIALSTSSNSWPGIKSVLTEAWNRSGGPEFREGKYGLYHDRNFANVVADYKRAVGDRLGEMAPVKVPRYLNDHYQLLISLGRNSVVGQGACDLAGMTPLGKDAIDALSRANRVDLIANVLKGYNPGGRVYAAVALTRMQRKGINLHVDVLPTLEIVRNLDLPIETCDGCLRSKKTAKKIIDEWQF
jgi:hypothetical protein